MYYNDDDQFIRYSIIGRSGALSFPDIPRPVEEDVETRPEGGSGVLGFLWETVQTVLLAVVIFLLINAGFGRFRVVGQSMEPNFHQGQYLVINKVIYHLREPARGDVVVFHNPRYPRRDFIKRIIGLPGEQVEIRRGQVFINGQPLQEPYPVRPGTYSSPPYQLGPDEYFVLGDNRNFSSDSHSWGAVPRRNIIGKAWFCYWPPRYWQLIPSY